MTIPRIRQPRAVIDRKALTVVLEDLAATVTDNRERRARLLAVLKGALGDGRAEVRRRFLEEKGTGAAVFAENSHLMDQIIRLLFDFTTTHVYPRANRTIGEQMTVLAVGGYGRGEMSPQSDVDLLFLLPYKATPLHEQVVEYMLYTLWDMGLKVGHATRSIEECIRQARGDLTIRTAMLETRYLWGDRALYGQLKTKFWTGVVTGTGPDFVEAKLAERDERHLRMGDSRYVLEPNIKDGKGGLRDLHTLLWIARYIYGVSDMRELVELGVLSADAATKFGRARAFLWTVRCHLHYLADRPEERLTFDVQPAIAARMGYTDRNSGRGVERFMKHYFLMAKTVGDLTRIFCAVLEDQQKRRPILSIATLLMRKRNLGDFVLDGGRLAVAGRGAFREHPLQLISLFKVAHDHGLDIHPDTLRLVTEHLPTVTLLRNDAKANALFMEILTSRKDPELALRQLSESGVLARFIPDFGRVTAQMQFDMYHVYTTDEHTIRAIGLLHRLETGALRDRMPAAADAVHKVQSRRALYLAVLLHDIAKGRGGDHSILGAEVAMRLGPRLGMSEEETETVAWLVRHHLDMSRTAFKRDLDDIKTILDFTGLVQSVERLHLLLALTTVDILAVGPAVWNNWKSSLLRELYTHSKDVLTSGFQAEARDKRVAHKREELAAALADWPQASRERYLDLHYPAYWLTFDSATHLRHARMLRRARDAGLTVAVEVLPDPERAVSEVLVATDDHPGLFSKIAGAMALAGVNILDAKITTMSDGGALDIFTVQTLEGHAIEKEERIARLAKTVRDVLTGDLPLEKALRRQPPRLPERTRHLTVPPRVIVDNQASKTHTVIEINGRDRPGFLYAVTRALTDVAVQISSARVSTYGERVVDSFYVKDVFGMKIVHRAKLAQIREALEAAITQTVPRKVEEGAEQGAEKADAGEIVAA
ncbi:[protein-PII] uridylyltransferase [Rhodospirillum rubrum]|uniref:Bifunctional uridylyltransferase/uridylyl-removing enzyme n=1 Tax=Rhodospirillum rubrum (strain ATCC 11170 / ATH 1.1.1 / DSM 467 / LMG 4362 / NCIMB 8255 / S1) TaxID=269796 RepID=GLND_RHORT|nr:[protein-PII] uridylyltransferase [Rhodospirillum rubrum]Q2RNG2.1 RecName: Full=Bifunctional uridylyltransferase/uridylyl-removing enzyme; Short=UTase/UR; AltName: Full=Bifunctional [protein-PII] modification enzyme; AltName: Full=Bifunctional nitrogen sensor protein; Includes: RecName: Full=[Protein-PII] uridylyltransferase; Short=PII uridylyltransferase; Short=UTase; Includes: RecName: Full=[Protein-PII]-UMP uridylyl-removing enzyme; Short=UR [Rhodospirillum rubrum ATCC 11170]ABC24333.1 GlnB